MNITKKILTTLFCGAIGLGTAQAVQAQDANPFQAELPNHEIHLADINSQNSGKKDLEKTVITDGGIPASGIYLASADTSATNAGSLSGQENNKENQNQENQNKGNQNQEKQLSNTQSNTNQISDNQINNNQTNTNQTNTNQTNINQEKNQEQVNEKQLQSGENKTQEQTKTQEKEADNNNDNTNPFAATIPEEDVNKFKNLSNDYNKADPSVPEQKTKKEQVDAQLDQLIKKYVLDPISNGKVDTAVANQLEFERQYKNSEHLEESREAVRKAAIDDIIAEAQAIIPSIPRLTDEQGNKTGYDKQSKEFRKFEELQHKAGDNLKLLNVEENLYNGYVKTLEKFNNILNNIDNALSKKTYDLEKILVADFNATEKEMYEIFTSAEDAYIGDNEIDSKQEMEKIKDLKQGYVNWKKAVDEYIAAETNTENNDYLEKRKQLSVLLQEHIDNIDKEINKGVQIYNEGLESVDGMAAAKERAEGQDAKITDKKEWDEYNKLYTELKKQKTYYENLASFWELENTDGTQKEIGFNDIVGKLEEMIEDVESKRFDYQKHVKGLHDSVAKESEEIKTLYKTDSVKAREKALALGERVEEYVKTYGSEFEKDRGDVYKIASGIIVKQKPEQKETQKKEEPDKKQQAQKIQKTVQKQAATANKTNTQVSNVTASSQTNAQQKQEPQEPGFFKKVFTSIADEYQKNPWKVISIGVLGALGLGTGAYFAAKGIKKYNRSRA